MKPVDQSFESLNSEVIYSFIFSLCGFLKEMKLFHFHFRLAKYSVSHLIYSNTK